MFSGSKTGRARQKSVIINKPNKVKNNGYSQTFRAERKIGSICGISYV
jgi:hypothetical protein